MAAAAGRFQLEHAAGDLLGAAKAEVFIDDDRNLHRRRNDSRLLDELVERNKADVGHAESAPAERAGAGKIRGFEPLPLDQSRPTSRERTGNDDRGGGDARPQGGGGDRAAGCMAAAPRWGRVMRYPARAVRMALRLWQTASNRPGAVPWQECSRAESADQWRLMAFEVPRMIGIDASRLRSRRPARQHGGALSDGRQRAARRRGLSFDGDLLDAMIGRPQAVALQTMIDWHGLDDSVAGLAAETRRSSPRCSTHASRRCRGDGSGEATGRQCGALRGAASSGPDFAHDVLTRLGLMERFQFVLTAQDVVQGSRTRRSI